MVPCTAIREPAPSQQAVKADGVVKGGAMVAAIDGLPWFLGSSRI